MLNRQPLFILVILAAGMLMAGCAGGGSPQPAAATPLPIASPIVNPPPATATIPPTVAAETATSGPVPGQVS